MNYKILVIEFGIKNLVNLKLNLVFNKKTIKVTYANSFLDIAEIIYFEKINLIILCDFRGREKTSVYIKMVKKVFTDVKVLILTNEKSISNTDKLYYIQKGAENYLFYDEFQCLKEWIIEDSNLFDCDERVDNWRNHTNKIIRLLKEYYIDGNNVVKKISARTGYSISLIYRYVKEDTGKTIGNWITQLRLNGAKELLSSTNNSIKYIANKIGYKSSQGFIKAFRKETNLTPKEFRNKNLK